MKQTITTLILSLAFNFPLFAQESTPIFTITENGEIVINERFISMSSLPLPFSTDSIGSTSIGNDTYILKAGRFEHWEEEPGDFDVIQFYKNNQLILTYKDFDCIVRLDNSQNFYAYPLKQYSINGYYIEINVTDSTKVLIFIGQHYGTDLSKLILFVVTPDDVKLVYNQKVAIISINKGSKSFSMLVQSNIPNEGEKPMLHTIEMENGVLKFKDYNG